jgi:hypothetical protein
MKFIRRDRRKKRIATNRAKVLGSIGISMVTSTKRPVISAWIISDHGVLFKIANCWGFLGCLTPVFVTFSLCWKNMSVANEHLCPFALVPPKRPERI